MFSFLKVPSSAGLVICVLATSLFRFSTAVQWRSVAFPFRYAQEGETSAEGLTLWQGPGTYFRRKCLFWGPRKCHFPWYPGGSVINHSMKEANYSVILLSICQPLVLLNDVSVYQFSVLWLQEKGKTSPFKKWNLETTDFVNILVLKYVENCQWGQPILTHSASNRGFQSFHAAKTAFGSAIYTG